MSGLGAAWRLAVGTLTIFPVRPVAVDRTVAGRAMALAPFVGVALGLAAAAVLAAVGAATGSPFAGAVLAVGALAWLTRALHLDGLADLADGLGSGKPADGALDVMKRSDIGPFGVVTVMIALLVQVAVLSRPDPAAWTALVAAAATGRLAVTWACREGVPAARPGGLGALVAGTVRRTTAVAVTVATAAVVVIVAFTAAAWPPNPSASLAAGPFDRFHVGYSLDSPGPVRKAAGDTASSPGNPPSRLPAEPRLGAAAGLLLAMAAGLAAAALLRRRAVRRLGGVTGDVLGALVETATTVTLLAAAVLV